MNLPKNYGTFLRKMPVRLEFCNIILNLHWILISTSIDSETQVFNLTPKIVCFANTSHVLRTKTFGRGFTHIPCLALCELWLTLEFWPSPQSRSAPATRRTPDPTRWLLRFEIQKQPIVPLRTENSNCEQQIEVFLCFVPVFFSFSILIKIAWRVGCCAEQVVWQGVCFVMIGKVGPVSLVLCFATYK